MSAATVCVFEQSPWWLPELQRQLLSEDVHVRGVVSLADLEGGPKSVNPTLAVIALAGVEVRCLQFLGKLSLAGESLPVIVIGTTATAEWEWTLRELGAAQFVRDTAGGEEVAELCRRLIQNSQHTIQRGSGTDHFVKETDEAVSHQLQ